MADGDRLPDAALLIDWENIKFSLQQRNIRPNISAVRDAAETFGRVVVARAYADWQDGYHRGDPSNLYAAGIEPIYVPTRSYREDDGETKVKNSVDVKLTADCIELCHNYESVGVFVLVTGDQDFLHVVNTLRPYGKRVVIFGVSWTTSARLAERVDAVLYYDREIEPIETPPVAEPQNDPAALARAHLIDAALAEVMRTVGVPDDLVVEQRRVLEQILAIVTDYRSRGQSLPLSSLGMELNKRTNAQTFSIIIKGRSKQLTQALQSQGLLRVETQGLVDWLYLPGERVPDAVQHDDDVLDSGWSLLSEHYTELSQSDRRDVVRALQELRAQPGITYLTFNRMCDQLATTTVGRRSGGNIRRLVSGMVEAGILRKDQEQMGFDPTTGSPYTFTSFNLNLLHPLVADCTG